jgi:hypothetical protein
MRSENLSSYIFSFGLKFPCPSAAKTLIFYIQLLKKLAQRAKLERRTKIFRLLYQRFRKLALRDKLESSHFGRAAKMLGKLSLRATVESSHLDRAAKMLGFLCLSF